MAGTKTLRVGVLTPVNTLNPREAQDFVSQMAVAQIYEPPFAQPEAGRLPEPLLFQERLRQDGPNEYSAAVRSDVRFSDGTLLTARHVADSLARVTALREQAEVEARGERVLFRLHGRTRGSTWRWPSASVPWPWNPAGLCPAPERTWWLRARRRTGPGW